MLTMQPHKRGDSFSRLTELPLTNSDGSPAFADGYFVGWTVSAQVRTAQFGKLIANLECLWEDPLTTRVLFVNCLDTKSWEIGPAEMDVQFVRASDQLTMSTLTVRFDIIRDVTRAVS